MDIQQLDKLLKKTRDFAKKNTFKTKVVDEAIKRTRKNKK